MPTGATGPTGPAALTLPGFIFGKYIWRDEDEINAHALVPAVWNPDIGAIGEGNFVYGVGMKDNLLNDLKLVGIEQAGPTGPSPDSMYPRIQHGTLWTGWRRYFYPADGYQLEFLSCGPGHSTTYTLSQTPRMISPIFVGTWALDNEGFYEYASNYRYSGTALDDTYSDPQFSLVRATKTLTVSQTLPTGNVAVGQTTTETSATDTRVADVFQMAVYPVAGITDVTVIDPNSASPVSVMPYASIDLTTGFVSLTLPAGGGAGHDWPKAGMEVWVAYNPALAVLYETGSDDGTSATETTLGSTVELNPALSGVSQGYLYLQNRRKEVEWISLTADKPLISQDLFGPVNYENDYALLTATVWGTVLDEVIPGVVLQVIPSAGFQGYINYRDPMALLNAGTPLTITSGGDGMANIIYTAPDVYGNWISTGNVSGANLTLPVAVPIAQLKNSGGWTVLTYYVLNNNPLFGMVGADVGIGQIPWTTSGTPGHIDYKTNGEDVIIASGGVPVYPSDALDGDGHSYTSGSFNGTVKTLVYPSSLPTGATIGAYFVSYVLRVSLLVQDVTANIQSNLITLQLQTPIELPQFNWFILNDAVYGVLNSNRLGMWSPSTTPVAMTPVF